VPHIIVVGNEKGGSGKSTTSMHVATALARMGHATGAMDLDLRQRSFGRYVENRMAHLAREGLDMPSPDYRTIAEGDAPIEERFGEVMQALDGAEFVVIDCPGSHTRLSQIAHSLADTLVTPLNDSFVDFDLLARIDPETDAILGPSVYSEMVWGARQARARAGLKPIDWVVIRNRLGAQAMHNKRRMEDAVTRLAPRIGFRVAPGFAERVVFRELFPKGLTLLDLRDVGVTSLSMSNVAARQELRDLIRALKLPGVEPRF
jgi:chromosome partitioning protein